jgi:N-acetylmuramoyl-L-alanine amidase
MFPQRNEETSSFPSNLDTRREHLLPTAVARRRISAILFDVRNILGVVALAFAISALLPFAATAALARQDQQGNPQPAPEASPPPAQQTPPPPTQAPAPAGPVIVLNPAHGGTDSGARGQNGVAEKDLVLLMARGVKSALERQGFRVILTRNDDSNPSYDDRAAMANASRDAIFISLHMASSGTVGSVRAYYDQLGTPYVPSASAVTAGGNAVLPAASGLNSWNEAQRSYVNASHRLADLIQIELAQKFNGSADTSLGAAVRGLRSVAAPAVAIELSSVSVPNPDALANLAAGPLADAVARAVTAFRALTPGGAKQ